MDKKIFSLSEIKILEKAAQEELSISEFNLMERAGKAAFEYLRTIWPNVKHIFIVCGPGKNGGDGLVLASLAKNSGMTVTLRTVVEPAESNKKAFNVAKEADIPIKKFNPTEPINADLIVDAIFGVGLNRMIAGEFAEAIEAMNKSGLPILAIDIPSGIQADSGEILGVAVQATATITFIGLKRGLFLNEGLDHSGKVRCADLALPTSIFQKVPEAAHCLEPDLIKKYLPPRRQNTHKGNFGHVLIVGGNKGMGGAARLAAEAALRTGAGLVSVASHPSNQFIISARCPEIMCHGLSDPTDLEHLLARASVLVIGPGLGQDDWGRGMFLAAIDHPVPKVIDADGLNLLGKYPCCQEDWILTPHPGEAARVLGTSVAEIQQDRFSTLDQLYALGGKWVLKGASTLVKSDSVICLCHFGNPGMASGGMGDALTGVIAGLIAQGIALSNAPGLGVLIHALAGDLAAEAGERGLIASDLINHLQQVVNPQEDHKNV